MENYKVSSALFYITAVLFYLAAIINFASGNHTSTAIVWLSLGSSFLCLGSMFSNKAKKAKEDEEKKD